MKFIYQIIEENLDGDGDSIDATEYVESSRRLNQAEELVLKQCLENAKASDSGGDTYEKVNDAIKEFKDRTGRELRPIDSPFAATIMF